MFRTKVDTNNKQIYKRTSTAKRGLVSLINEYDMLYNNPVTPITTRVGAEQLVSLLKKQIKDIVSHTTDLRTYYIPVVLMPAFLSAYYDSKIDSDIIKQTMEYVSDIPDTEAISLQTVTIYYASAERVCALYSKFNYERMIKW